MVDAMNDPPMPPSKFRRFEKVVVASDGGEDAMAGQEGVIVWCDRPCLNRRSQSWGEWGYAVYLPEIRRYGSFVASKLATTGQFEAEDVLRGDRFEISFDTPPGDDMIEAEGCFRIPGQFWQVFVFSNEDAAEVGHRFQTWQSGVTGVAFQIPMRTPIGLALILAEMSRVFAADRWHVTEGPESLDLK